MLSDEQIVQFQALYQNRFGEDISREEAHAKGAKLVRLVELIYRSMTEDDFKLVQERRKTILSVTE